MQNNQARINPTSWVITVGICCYILMLGFIGLTHEHDHDILGSDDCSACLFSANHVGIAIDVVELASVENSISIQPLVGVTFLPATPTDNIQSRAPPTSSV